MLSLVFISILSIVVKSEDEEDKNDKELLEEIFPHYQFTCSDQEYFYETTFTFLQGLGRGFVHVEPYRIYFDYYFPAEHWIGFATADQEIEGETDHCTQCYFDNYYQSSSSINNHSNLYPNCIDECLDETIFVATVNSDEENINDWNIIEFQIELAEISKTLDTSLVNESLSFSSLYPYTSSYLHDIMYIKL